MTMRHAQYLLNVLIDWFWLFVNHITNLNDFVFFPKIIDCDIKFWASILAGLIPFTCNPVTGDCDPDDGCAAQGKVCSEGRTCVEGECVDLCEGVECGEGEVCDSGTGECVEE